LIAVHGGIALSTVNGGVSLADGGNGNGLALSATGIGSGSIVVEANGSASDIVLAAGVVSETGGISLRAGRQLAQNANITIASNGAAPGANASINLEALTGSITMANGTATSLPAASSGSIRLWAGVNVIVSSLQAVGGNVSVTAKTGGIAEAAPAAAGLVEISAQAARLEAGRGVGVLGASANPLELSVGKVAAIAGHEGINIENNRSLAIDNVTVSTGRATLAGAVETIAETLNGLSTINTGSIVARLSAGSLTVAAGSQVSAHGSGVVLLELLATGQTIAINGLAGSGGGAVSIINSGAILLGSSALVQNFGLSSSIELESFLSTVAMADGARIQSNNGNIRLKAFGDVTATGLAAASGQASLASTFGSILDGGDSRTDIQSAYLRLQAAGAAGASGNALETAAGLLTAQAGGGGINLSQDGALIITSVSVNWKRASAQGTVSTQTDASQSDLATANNGNITLRSRNGHLSLLDGLINNTSVNASGSGSILIELSGSCDININATIKSATGSITLKAGRNIKAGPGALVDTTGEIILLANQP
jgi:hypothetical protein